MPTSNTNKPNRKAVCPNGNKYLYRTNKTIETKQATQHAKPPCCALHTPIDKTIPKKNERARVSLRNPPCKTNTHRVAIYIYIFIKLVKLNRNEIHYVILYE